MLIKIEQIIIRLILELNDFSKSTFLDTDYNLSLTSSTKVYLLFLKYCITITLHFYTKKLLLHLTILTTQ